MPTHVVNESTELTQTLQQIVQRLSPSDQEQVVNFARFLQWQQMMQPPALQSAVTADERIDEQSSDIEILADETRWDQKLAATPQVLKSLIAQAREEIRTGQTYAMIFTEDGRISPG